MKDVFVKTSEQLFMIPSWSEMDGSLAAGFTTKNGGVGKGHFSTLNIAFHVHDKEEDILQNREIVAGQTGFPVSAWVGAEQTHRTNIAKVTKADKGRGANDYASALRDTDGMYTDEQGVLLTLCYADCVPVYFFAPKHRLLGVAHAGWKGTVSGIAAEMVAAWNALGVESGDIHAAIGPSICGKCYAVDDRVISSVDKIVAKDSEKPYNLSSPGQYNLDLKQLNAQILRNAGVKNIAVSSLCTSCHKEEFFSHRRDHGKTGRMMAFIGWKEDCLKK